MRYLAVPPSPALREHVEALWTLSDTPGHARERIIPSGTIELVINVHEDAFRIFSPFGARERTFRGAIVSGCYSRAFEFDTRAHTQVVGVHFKPAGAGRLLGVPPGALANEHVALEDLWGRSATELRELLCATPSARERMDALDQALIARSRQRDGHRHSVLIAAAELDEPGVEVGAVARMLGLSRRRFIEVFTENVGMTPKRYSMVRRFQRALAIAQRGPRSWPRIALECGYYDQAHLCRDWLELTGVSPTTLLGQRDDISVKENHVAMPASGVKSIQYTRAPRK